MAWRCRRSTIRGQKVDTDLLFLNRILGRLLDMRPLCPAVSHAYHKTQVLYAYQGSDIGKLLVGGDEHRLYEKLVAALRIWRWVFLHRLEENWAHVSAS